MASKLIGGPQLRARLEAIKRIPDGFALAWAEDTKSRMERTHPPASRSASRRFSVKTQDRRAGVYGAYWWVFVDRGTKAHDIRPKKAKVLRFRNGQETIFARKAHVRRIARRPFITRAAQEALSGSQFSDLVTQTWNRKRLRIKSRFI